MIICGQCNKEYASEKSYLKHRCPITGAKPTEGRAMGVFSERIQAKALARGQKIAKK